MRISAKINIAKNNPDFELNIFITADETWDFLFDPQSKR
jgi:hypothetical protein